MSTRFNDGDKIHYNDMKPTDRVRLYCADIGYPDVAIDTTHKEIMDGLSYSKKECNDILPLVKIALMNKNIEKMYNEKGNEWKDFCNDVTIYYVCRYVIYGTIIPICAINPVDDDNNHMLKNLTSDMD